MMRSSPGGMRRCSVVSEGGSSLRIAQQGRARLAFEGRAPRQHLEQHRAERKDVGACVGFEALDLLGRHVLKRAENRPLGRQVRRRRRQHREPARRDAGAALFASPKSSSLAIGGADAPRFGEEDVAGLRSR